MKITRMTATAGALALVLMGGLAACGNNEPIELDEISLPDEIQAGGGLVTGRDGELVYELGADPGELAEEIKAQQ